VIATDVDANSGVPIWKVRWQGHGPEFDTWEPTASFDFDPVAVLEAYNQSQAAGCNLAASFALADAEGAASSGRPSAQLRPASQQRPAASGIATASSIPRPAISPPSGNAETAQLFARTHGLLGSGGGGDAVAELDEPAVASRTPAGELQAACHLQDAMRAVHDEHALVPQSLQTAQSDRFASAAAQPPDAVKKEPEAAESMPRVQCDRCGKWREVVDIKALPDEWFCKLNADQKYSSCEVAEQDWSHGEGADGEGRETDEQEAEPHRKTPAAASQPVAHLRPGRRSVMEIPAVGQRIRVWWTLEQQWYFGACVQVDPPPADENPADPIVHIQYDDGEVLQYSARHLASGKGWEAASGPGRGEPAESVVACPSQTSSGQFLKDTPGWEAQMAKLKNYKAKHGDCNVPSGWAEDPTLGAWVHKQRFYKRKLDRGEPSKGMTAARVARLTALSLNWHPPNRNSPNEAQWEAQLAKLEEYRLRHGDCNVPKSWAEDPRLGTWVRTQRIRKKKLDRGEDSDGMMAARAVKLEALSFSWEISADVISKHSSSGKMNDASWETQLAKLKAYKAAHGDCNVPRCWTEDPRLGRWVDKQRELKRKLDRGEPSEGMTAVRVAKLEALGFTWELSVGRPDNWEMRLKELKAFKAIPEHGHCNVPNRYPPNPSLGVWVSTQRYQKQKYDNDPATSQLTAEHVAALETLGLVWNFESRPDNWEMRLEELKAFKAMPEHGHCNVPNRYPPNPQLAKWVNHQRVQKKKHGVDPAAAHITAARIAVLEALGFVWVANGAAATTTTRRQGRCTYSPEEKRLLQDTFGTHQQCSVLASVSAGCA
jgi:hypothetical protein